MVSVTNRNIEDYYSPCTYPRYRGDQTTICWDILMSCMQPWMWSCFPGIKISTEEVRKMRSLNLLSISCRLRALSLLSLSAWFPTLTASSCILLASLSFSATWEEEKRSQFLPEQSISFYLLIFPPRQIPAPSCLSPQLTHSLSVGSRELQRNISMFPLSLTQRHSKSNIQTTTCQDHQDSRLTLRSVRSRWRWQWWDSGERICSNW